jgi:hypothetical protein
MQYSAESIFAVKYIREYESIFETTLVRESVDPGDLFDEKTGDRKSGETVPLICLRKVNYCTILVFPYYVCDYRWNQKKINFLLHLQQFVEI